MADALERDLRAVYGAYEYLRAQDLTVVSTTSRLLRSGDLPFLAARIGEEMDELRGAVAGTHGHGDGRGDIVLEASQTLYWLFVLAVAAGDRYDDLRPHELLEPPPQAPGAAISEQQDWGAGTRAAQVSGAAIAELAWSVPLDDPAGRRRAVRARVATVARLCREAGVAVAEAVRHDMDELRAKAYLDPYWAAHDSLDAEHPGG